MEIEKNKGSICTLQRKHLCTHVTALKAYQNFLFVAESNLVLLFDWKEKILLEKEVVFKSCSIHGIQIDNKGNVVFFGAKSLRIFTFSSSSSKKFTQQSDEISLPDWIHDVQWLTEEQKQQNSFAVISAHNCLTIFDYEMGKNKIVQCAENCILYAGSIIISNVNLIIVAAGTVFQKILLWSPHSSKEVDGRKLPFQSLSGHQGVIFSVIYSKYHKLLSSTSDDRSVRLWKVHNNAAHTEDSLEFWENANITIAHVLFAHESRVWMSVVLKYCILSVGEDSNLCVWDLQGNLVKKKKCHKNGSIWCLEVAKIGCISGDTSEQENCVAFTGGSDGGVYGWEVESAFASRFISQISLPSKESSVVMDFPRVISLLTKTSSNHIMVTTDKGSLALFDINFKKWSNIFYDSSFSSYCVPSISYNNTYMALGNILGELVLIDLKDKCSDKSKAMKFKIHTSKISSIHWVNQSNDYLLTCGIKGIMILWKVIYTKGDFHMQHIQELNLPKCKHHWWSTAALYINSKGCIVGDRGGSISVYSILDTPNLQLENNRIDPCMAFRYIHGENGVTDIQEHNGLIYSAGRDGKVQLYVFSENALHLLHTIKVCHDLEWIGRMLFYREDLLLLGFHTKHFMVWSTLLESAVMTVECGGGHRSWDFSLTEEGQATFAAIKKKDVIFYQENLHHVLNLSILKGGISGQEFCHTTYLFTKTSGSISSMSIVACGGEDNTLRIIGFNHENSSQVVSICNLSGHLSSIRAISKVKIPEENALLFVSVGGRSQMMIWKIKDDSVLGILCEQLGSYILSDLEKATKKQLKKEQDIKIDPQTRLMDVSICYSEIIDSTKGKYIISTACSDSYFRIYLFDEKLRDLNLYYNFHHGENCILKLSQIVLKNPTDDILFFTGATDGRIKVFNYETCKTADDEILQTYTSFQQIEPSICMQLHQSGINALDVKHVKGSLWLICSAGDDNALAVALLNITYQMGKSKFSILCKNHVPNAHASQIVGVKIFEENLIVTASIDQRINIWKWNFSNNFLTIKQILSRMTLIPDIAHLDSWRNELSKSWTLLVCGQGMESFDLKFQNSLT